MTGGIIVQFFYGGNGKVEEHVSKTFSRQFFGNLRPEKDFNAVVLVGVQKYSRKYNETDLLVMFSCIEGSPLKSIKLDKIIKDGACRKDDKGVKEYLDIPANTPIEIRPLFLAVEVKEHSPEGVRKNGNDLEVYYSKEDKWVPASSKLIGQAATAKSFLKDQLKIQPIYNVHHFIYLANVNKKDLDLSGTDLHKVILFADSSYRDLIYQAILQNDIYFSLPRRKYILGENSASLTAHRLNEAADNFYSQVRASPLEQETLELIGAKFVDSKKKQWSGKLGINLIAFTGRAGTGKTLKLLRTANDLLEERYDRTLILTFNRALARGLERLLKLQHLSEGLRNCVMTTDQFLYQLCILLGIESSYEGSYKNFAREHGKDKFEFVRQVILDELSNNEQLQLVKKEINRSYDYLAIDEAQDWYPAERDIILSLFPPNKLIVAAGTDQRLRSIKEPNWKQEVKLLGFEANIVRDNTSFRMTTNLSKFNNTLANKLNLAWSVKPNQKLNGGQVFLFEEFDRSVLERMAEELFNVKTDYKYAPIDYLIMTSRNSEVMPFEILKDSGIDYWDGISNKDRSSIPLLNQIRCVSTESCRGLEGWSTLLLDVDGWFRFCRNRTRFQLQEYEGNRDVFEANLEQDPITENDIFAMPTWFMIPFTRAKYRMYIQLPRDYRLKKVLIDCLDDMPAFVQYL